MKILKREIEVLYNKRKTIAVITDWNGCKWTLNKSHEGLWWPSGNRGFNISFLGIDHFLHAMYGQALFATWDSSKMEDIIEFQNYVIVEGTL